MSLPRTSAALPIVTRSSDVYGRSTTRPRPGMTAFPCPKCPQPVVTEKSSAAMLPPSVVVGTAMAAISDRSAPVVMPGTGVSESRSAASSRPLAAEAFSSSAAPGVSPSGQPGRRMRGHSILRAPALAFR